MKCNVERPKAVSLMFCFALAVTFNAFAQPLRTATVTAKSAAEALARYEELLQATSDQNMKFYLTTKAAPTALAAGETEKAKTYSRALLHQATEMRKDWNYGNAIHIANLVLGRIALVSGDVEEAKRLLLKAGKTPGSPQLDTFGPNMLLAKELLEKGERRTVIEYFELCAKFWKPKDGLLEMWKGIVMEGVIPDFRGNLSYYLDGWRVQNWDKLRA